MPWQRRRSPNCEGHTNNYQCSGPMQYSDTSIPQEMMLAFTLAYVLGRPSIHRCCSRCSSTKVPGLLRTAWLDAGLTYGQPTRISPPNASAGVVKPAAVAGNLSGCRPSPEGAETTGAEGRGRQKATQSKHRPQIPVACTRAPRSVTPKPDCLCFVSYTVQLKPESWKSHSSNIQALERGKASIVHPTSMFLLFGVYSIADALAHPCNRLPACSRPSTVYLPCRHASSAERPSSSLLKAMLATVCRI